MLDVSGYDWMTTMHHVDAQDFSWLPTSFVDAHNIRGSPQHFVGIQLIM